MYSLSHVCRYSLSCAAEACAVGGLAVGAAKGGAQSVKPLLQNLYRTRASAYQRAVRSFVEGYREGLVEQPQDSSGPDVPPAAQAREKPQARSESRPTK